MRVARLIGRLHPAVVLALGDLQYPAGTQPAFDHSYGPSWGRFKSITRPVPGNHDYGTRGASGYFGYFGARAAPLQPWCHVRCIAHYSYSIGRWHVVALDTRCSESARICVGLGAEAAWLDRDLRSHPARCTLAYMHNPLFSGGFGATPALLGIWRVLHAHGVDLVLSGHAHNYQRFISQTPRGWASAAGITEIVAGTGGARLFTL
ncbi:MAG: metallophosphoesterase family protein, partial [Jatrophihabitantaceae bacterium]